MDSAHRYPRVGVDPQMLAIVFIPTSIAFFPAIVLGALGFLVWRLLHRGQRSGWLGPLLIATGALALAVAVTVVRHGDPGGDYMTQQAGLLQAGVGLLTGGGWPGVDLPAYLVGVLPLALPGAVLVAALLSWAFRAPPARLGRREATGVVVPKKVEQRAAQGVPHPADGWALGYRADGQAVGISDAEGRLHTIICGATGSGKTTIVRHLVEGVAGRCAVVLVDCKASRSLRQAVEAVPNSVVWTIGGPVRWDALRGDPTALANKLLIAEYYGAAAAVYRAAAERYVQWIGRVLACTGEARDPALVGELLHPGTLSRRIRQLRATPGIDAARVAVVEPIAQGIAAMKTVDTEGVQGFANRYGVLVEGVAGASLGAGPGALVLEDAIRAGRTVLFSLDAATYPDVAAKLGAWVLLDLVRVAGALQDEGWGERLQCTVVIDEFSALGQEGRHVVHVLARAREAGMACVVSTQGLADLARVDRTLPQQVVQNTAVRILLRQGSAEDAEGWARILGQYEREELSRHTDDTGSSTGTAQARWKQEYHVSPDELRVLGTGEAIVAVAPVGRTRRRIERVLVARPGAKAQVSTRP